MKKHLSVITILIAINIIVFIVPILLKTDMLSGFALYFPKNESFGLWQYITYLFVHGGSFHLLFNLYALWAFGSPLLRLWGSHRFLVFYFLSGIIAGIIYTLVNDYQFNGIYEQLAHTLSKHEIQAILDTGKYDVAQVNLSNDQMNEFYTLYHAPVVGASGAIYGVLVAFGLIFPNTKLALLFFPVPLAAKYFIPLLIAGDLFFGVTQYSIGNIAHFAHIGGALTGFLIAWYWEKSSFKRKF